jgi:3'(2'),5'-bisphosphate nucleotidase (EC 3.1.3.7)
MDYELLTSVMRRAALDAGDAIMQVYAAADFDVRAKSDDSPVTAADLAADAVISAALRAAFPDVALVTEEQAASHMVQATAFFIVDPLDGTKEFVQRRGDFTVNIAYVVDGVPLRGIVYAACAGPVVLYRCHRPVGRGNSTLCQGCGGESARHIGV